MKEKDNPGLPRVLPAYAGEMEEAEAFEEGLVDASWIPDMYSYMSLGEFRNRLNELEEYAAENLDADRRGK